MGHVMVAVPEGHTVQVHPPGVVPQGLAPMGPGIVADAAHQGALQALTNSLPQPSQNEDQAAPKPKAKPAKTEVKKPKSKVKPKTTAKAPTRGGDK